jgi:hypothetical protein
MYGMGGHKILKSNLEPGTEVEECHSIGKSVLAPRALAASS